MSIFPGYFVAGNEKAFEAIGVADTDLNVILVVEAGAGVKFGAFDKDTTNGIEGFKVNLPLQVMQIFDNGAIQFSQ